jgi:hypothetical protein
LLHICRCFPRFALHFRDIADRGGSRLPYHNCLQNVCQSMEVANEVRPEKRTVTCAIRSTQFWVAQSVAVEYFAGRQLDFT